MLEPFSLNLVVDTKKERSSIWIFTSIISILLIFIIIMFLYKYYNNKIVISDYKNKILQIRKKKLQKEKVHSYASLSKEDIEKIYFKKKFINRLVLFDQFPWTALFNMLESMVPEGILLSDFAHTPKIDSLFISGHSRSSASLYQLLQDLYTSDIVKKYYIEKVIVVNKDEKNTFGLKFNLKIDINTEFLFNKQYRKTIKKIL
jgi:Tfp pilus assembly protein PilN